MDGDFIFDDIAWQLLMIVVVENRSRCELMDIWVYRKWESNVLKGDGIPM